MEHLWILFLVACNHGLKIGCVIVGLMESVGGPGGNHKYVTAVQKRHFVVLSAFLCQHMPQKYFLATQRTWIVLDPWYDQVYLLLGILCFIRPYYVHC